MTGEEKFFMAIFIIFFFINPICSSEKVLIDLKTNKDGTYIGKRIFYFEDRSGEVPFKEIRQKNFIRSEDEEPNFGFNPYTYWLKFTISNSGKSNKPFLLEISYPIIDEIILFDPIVKNPTEDSHYNRRKLGTGQSFEKRELLYRNFIYSLNLKSGEEKTFYMRIRSFTSKTFPLQLWSLKTFTEKVANEELFLGVFYGIMMVMLFYNLFLLFSVRDINYFYYLFWIVNATMVQMSLNGYSFEYFWPESFWWNKHNIPFFMSMGGLFGIQFARVFLDTRTRQKRIDKYLIGLMVISIVSIILSLSISYAPAIRIATVLWIIIPVSMIITTLMSLRDGYKPARYFFIGWISAFLGTGIFAGKALGMLPNSFLTKWGMQIGVALEVTLISLGLGDRINQLKEEKEHAQKILLETKNNMLDSFARFVPKQFLKYLKKETIEDVRLGDAVSYDMTVLFSDIRKFTDMSEAMTPDESFSFLNSFLKRMEPIIQDHNGFVDKYIGDAVMALFPDSSEDALNTAIKIREELIVYNEHRRSSGYVPIDIGLGIHSGKLTLGTVGSSKRIDTTVIGDTVNLASRIESLTKYYDVPIIISNTVYDQISNKNEFLFREIDRVKVKGKKRIVALYELFNSDDSNIKGIKKEQQIRFDEAMELYRSASFEKALAIFEELSRENPLDKIHLLYIQRCKYLIENPPSEKWRGVSRMARK